MAKSLKIQQAIALTVALMLAAPLGAFAADGKKHYSNGLKFEENRQWDKARSAPACNPSRNRAAGRKEWRDNRTRDEWNRPSQSSSGPRGHISSSLGPSCRLYS